jgi:CO/xanthine dehydrogenase FAD-binding subunit
LVTAVWVPDKPGYKSGYEKTRIRRSLDFAIVALAYAYKLEGGKIKDISLVLGGVAPVPVKLYVTEEYLLGKSPSKETAEHAGELAVKNAEPMSQNTYKVNTAAAMVKRLVQAMAQA